MQMENRDGVITFRNEMTTTLAQSVLKMPVISRSSPGPGCLLGRG